MSPLLPSTDLPPDHARRLARGFAALEGLAVGDALGQQYFVFPEWIEPRTLPVGPWNWTDDTAMAAGLVEVLARHGRIQQDHLATVFARNYAAEPNRGYGGTAHGILRDIGRGRDWRTVAAAAFEGQGSMGNGAAMRVAPLGAYFADDPARVAAEARLSAEVTHAHPDGIAGGIAVAVAAAVAASNIETPDFAPRMWTTVLDLTPLGPTRSGIEMARRLRADARISSAIRRLGTGEGLIASDTVPFCLWIAARHFPNYEEAFWQTVYGLGDRDTTAAIVGGIIAAGVGRDGIPPLWLAEREPLPVHDILSSR